MYSSLFDEDFRSHFWSKRPVALKIPSGKTPCSEQELLQALLRYSVDSRSLKENNSLCEYVTAVNNQKTQSVLRELAVSPEDRTLNEYINRVDSIYKDQFWSIAYFGMHGASVAVWDFAKQFSDQLSAAIGYRPGGRIDVDCFVGRYECTPSGIHVDDAHNFGFTFRNGKKMYTWPPERTDLKFLKVPDYDSSKNDATILNNVAGEVCYFPHDWYHVGETPSDVSVNLNISLWYASDDVEENIKYILSKLYAQQTLENPVEQNGVVTLSAENRKNINILTNMLNKGALEKQMALRALLVNTTGGMKVPRPISPYSASGNKIRLRKYASIQWYEMDNLSEILIGVNGHCITIDYAPAMILFLDALTRKENDITSIIDVPLAQRDLKIDLTEFVRSLYAWGALEENCE